MFSWYLLFIFESHFLRNSESRGNSASPNSVPNQTQLKFSTWNLFATMSEEHPAQNLIFENVSPATRLLEKRRQMYEVQEALENQKAHFAKEEVRRDWMSAKCKGCVTAECLQILPNVAHPGDVQEEGRAAAPKRHAPPDPTHPFQQVYTVNNHQLKRCKHKQIAIKINFNKFNKYWQK